MAHRDLGVADFAEAPKLFRDLVSRSGDQGFRRDADQGNRVGADFPAHVARNSS
jgi:hypothetical protein